MYLSTKLLNFYFTSSSWNRKGNSAMMSFINLGSLRRKSLLYEYVASIFAVTISFFFFVFLNNKKNQVARDFEVW